LLFYYEQRAFQDFIDLLEKTFPLSLIDHDLLSKLSYSYLQLGEMELALKYSAMSLALDLDNELALYVKLKISLFYSLFTSENKNDTIRLARRYISVKKFKGHDSLNLLAYAYATNGDFERSIYFQKKAIFAAELDGYNSIKQHKYLKYFEKGEIYKDEFCDLK